METVRDILVLKNVQIKYACIAEPKQLSPEEVKKGFKPDYLLSVYFPKTNVAIKQHLDNARVKFLNKLGLPDETHSVYSPLYIDGIISEDSFYHDKYYLNSKSKIQPDIVDADCNPLINTTWKDFERGTYVNAVFQLYNYVMAGRKGISKIIKHIQIILPSDLPAVERPRVNYQSYIDSSSVNFAQMPSQNQDRIDESFLD